MTQLAFQRPVKAGCVSIIIPVYKDLVGLTDTIDSIERCDRKGIPEDTVEVIVVNDGGDDRISRFCQQRQITEVRITPNKGSYFARNRGLEACCGEFVAFVDADIIVDVGWIRNGFSTIKDADYVAGSIHVLKNGVSDTVVAYQQLIDFNTRWHMQTMHYGPTANVWVRRKVPEKIGGFNEALFSGGDMEFGIRVFEHPEFVRKVGEDVIANHPPRTLAGLFSKSKRLAYGHTVINDNARFSSKFGFLNSVKRNLDKTEGDASREIPLNVQILRITLYAHRLLLKVYYRFFPHRAEFDRVVKTSPEVLVIAPKRECTDLR